MPRRRRHPPTDRRGGAATWPPGNPPQGWGRPETTRLPAETAPPPARRNLGEPALPPGMHTARRQEATSDMHTSTPATEVAGRPYEVRSVHGQVPDAEIDQGDRAVNRKPKACPNDMVLHVRDFAVPSASQTCIGVQRTPTARCSLRRCSPENRNFTTMKTCSNTIRKIQSSTMFA